MMLFNTANIFNNILFLDFSSSFSNVVSHHLTHLLSERLPNIIITPKTTVY